MATYDEVKKQYNEILDNIKFDKCIREDTIHIILVNGIRIKIGTKSFWSNKSAAKSALRNYLSKIRYNSIASINDKVIDDNGLESYNITYKTYIEAEDEWIEKHVTFVPFEYCIINKLKK